MTQALQKAYLPAVIEAQEIPGIAVTERKLDTVAVSTLLTVFDWNLSHSRFHSVKNFIGAFFTAPPELRRQGSALVWRRLDINARPPGWTRHVAADPSRVLPKAQLAELALVQRPQAPLPVSTPVEAAPRAAGYPVGIADGRAAARRRTDHRPLEQQPEYRRGSTLGNRPPLG